MNSHPIGICVDLQKMGIGCTKWNDVTDQERFKSYVSGRTMGDWEGWR